MLRSDTLLTLAFGCLLGAGYIAGAAEPPQRPMVLHGVALVNGTPVPKGTVLTLSVDGQPVQTSLQEDFGQAHYSVAIPPTPVQPIRFTSLGENSLAALSTVCWQAGTVLRHDILVNCELAVPPRILGAIARLADDTWTLDCQFERLAQTAVAADRITYVVRWYLVKVPDDPATGVPPVTTLLGESRYPGTGTGPIASSLSVKQAVADLQAHLLRVVLGTQLDNGRSGPPDVRVVPITVTAGQL